MLVSPSWHLRDWGQKIGQCWHVCLSGGPQDKVGEQNALWVHAENVTLCDPGGRSAGAVMCVPLLFWEASVFSWFSLEIP